MFAKAKPKWSLYNRSIKPLEKIGAPRMPNVYVKYDHKIHQYYIYGYDMLEFSCYLSIKWWKWKFATKV